MLVAITKLSESLNASYVFLFVREEKLDVKRPLLFRALSWIFLVAQVPLDLGIVFTASPWAVTGLAGNMVLELELMP